MPGIALEIQSRSLVLDGRPFGAAGAYEKIAGTIRFAADPGHPVHASITDIGLAPRNAAGRVEFSADFYAAEAGRHGQGNGGLLLDVPQPRPQGRARHVQQLPRVPDPTTAADFGNGFLMRHG